MGFQNNQNTLKQQGLLGLQSQGLREPFLEVKSIPLPPDMAVHMPTQVKNNFLLFAGLSGKDLTASWPQNPIVSFRRII